MTAGIGLKCCTRNIQCLCCLLFCLELALTIFILPLWFTLPVPQSGSVLVGNDDLVLLLAFDPADVSKVVVNHPHFVSVDVFLASCSNIGPKKQSDNSITKLLDMVQGDSYRIDEFYLPKDSHIHYTFSPPPLSSNSLPCVATVYQFRHRSHYLEFLKSGHAVSMPNQTYCLPPNEKKNIFINPRDGGYVFVGLASSVTTALSYTVATSVLKYRVGDLQPTTCVESDACIIDSPDADKMQCILSLLVSAKTFAEITYTTELYSRQRQILALIIIPSIAAGLIVLLQLACFFTMLFKHFKNRRHTKAQCET